MLRVDDFVLAVLVAVRARQVALVRDVHHHRRERDDAAPPGAQRGGHQREHSRRARLGLVLVPNRADGQEVGNGFVNRGAVEPFGECLDDGALGTFRFSYGCEHGRRDVVEREDRRARHEVQEIAARRLEQVELARRQRDHLPTSGCSKRMYAGTVTSRCARPLTDRTFDPRFIARLRGYEATTQTSP